MAKTSINGQIKIFRNSVEIEEILKNGNYTEKEISEIKRYRYLTHAEIKELIGLAEGWLHPILITFAYTGLRANELVGLSWDMVDLKKQCLWVSTKMCSMKQLEQQCIYFNEELSSVLEKQKTNSHWVYLNSSGNQLSARSLR